MATVVEGAGAPGRGAQVPDRSARVTVQLFASVREAAGTGQVELPWGGGTVAQLRQALAAARPEIARFLERSMVAVNQEYALPDQLVSPGDEVAVIPPVSGGSGAPQRAVPARVVDAPLDLGELVSAVLSPEAGAVTTFLGVVRNHNVGRQVLFLEYEGYAPMACREMDTITAEAETRWPGCRLALAHRVGRLEIGEASVAIAAASAHRADAFAACRLAIEELKKRVPIWKKEHFAGGAVWIETAADRKPGAPGFSAQPL